MTRKRTDSIVFARRAALLLALIAAVCWGGRLLFFQESAGVVAGASGTFLFREDVERAGYYNDWFASSLEGRERAAVTIVGEGKTVEFRGVLSLGGPGAEASWTSAENFGRVLEGDELERLVPAQVIESALAWGRGAR